MNKVILGLFAVVLFFGACSTTQNTEKIKVASQQGDCVGVAPMKCLLVMKEGQTDWEFFYNTIDGFTYEPGYEYVLEVKVDKVENPAADQSSLKYSLVKEVSKEKKTSENLPHMPEPVLNDSIL